MIITSWTDLLAGRLECGDCALSMTDSTTAEGWMRKSNFNEVSKDPVQATVRADAARHHTRLFMDPEIKGYSQWFAGKPNNVADALSRDWHHLLHDPSIDVHVDREDVPQSPPLTVTR